MRLAYVCTNFNNAGVTREAVESFVRGKAGADLRIVVVDNRSRDDDLARLRAFAAEYNEVDLVESPSNLGYFRGLNLGLRHLQQRYAAHVHVVVGNNDLIFPEDFARTVDRYRAILEEWAVVAPDLVTRDGIHQNPHVRVPISSWRKRIWAIHASTYSAAVAVRVMARMTRRFTIRPENAANGAHHLTPGPVEQGYGACYLLGPAFWRHFRRLAAPTFLMQEEFFLYEQLKLIGQLTYYDPRFVVVHAGHATTGAIPNRRQWQFVRDAHRIYRQYASLSTPERRRFIERSLEDPE
jgi:GT2 family glycosyltransferase